MPGRADGIHYPRTQDPIDDPAFRKASDEAQAQRRREQKLLLAQAMAASKEAEAERDARLAAERRKTIDERKNLAAQMQDVASGVAGVYLTNHQSAPYVVPYNPRNTFRVTQRNGTCGVCASMTCKPGCPQYDGPMPVARQPDRRGVWVRFLIWLLGEPTPPPAPRPQSRTFIIERQGFGGRFTGAPHG